MNIEQGVDGNWYVVWEEPGSAWDYLAFFPGARVSCFGQYENALQLTGEGGDQ